MILEVVCFKNTKINAFTQPQFIDIEPAKAAVQLSRALQLDEEGKQDKQFFPLQMWHIGKFDDCTGVFTQKEPELLLVCRDVILDRKENKHARSNKA